jgi:hypothetical protein
MTQKFTLEETADLLSLDILIVKKYADQGLLPTIKITGHLTIDGMQLAKMLKVTNFDEPFIDRPTAAKMLGVTETMTVDYCKNQRIPHFVLYSGREQNFRMRRILFRKSLLEQWQEEQALKLETPSWWIEEMVRTKSMASFMKRLINMVALSKMSEQEKGCMIMHLEGKPMDKIMARYKRSKGWVRAIIDRGNTDLINMFIAVENLYNK